MLYFLSFENVSVPILEGYGVGIDFILCRNNEVCGNIGERLVPAGEGVTRAGRVGGCFCVAAVLYFLSLQYRSVPVLESYGVGIDFILCRDNKVCHDVCERLVPAGEGVPNASRVGGCFCVAAVLYFLSLKYRSVPVLEGYGVHFRLCGRNSDSAVLDSKLYGFRVTIVDVIFVQIVRYCNIICTRLCIIGNLKNKVRKGSVHAEVFRCRIISPHKSERILHYRARYSPGQQACIFNAEKRQRRIECHIESH